MKLVKLVTGFLLLFCVALSGQTVGIFLIPEGVESYTSNTDYIASDDINQNNSSGQTGDDLKPILTGFEVDLESIVSSSNVSLKLPLSFKRKSFRIKASLPYFISRKLNYSGGSQSTRGIGDLLLSATYTHNFSKISNEAVLSVKLPTGDPDNVENGYLVPLGTGSTDIVLANNLSYIHPRYQILNHISYRINGGVSRIAEVQYQNQSTESIEYRVENGNTLIFNTAFAYNLPHRFSAIAGLALISNGEGKMERTHTINTHLDEKGISANQDFTNLDFYPGLGWTIFRTDLMVSGKLPLYTKRNDANAEEDRGFELLFRLSRKLF